MDKPTNKRKKKSKKKDRLLPGVRFRDGRYTFRYSIKKIKNGKMGREQKETVSYATEEAAYNAGILIKASLLKDTYIDEKNISFGDWADKWFDLYEQMDRKGQTFGTRRSRKNVLKKEFGPIKLKDITGLQYQQYLIKLKKLGRKKNTILGLHSTMKMIVGKAVNPPIKILTTDFTVGVEIPQYKESVQDLKKRKTVELFYEKEELALFLQAAYSLANSYETEQEQMQARQCARALNAIAYSGLRIGELCGLFEDDLSKSDRKINIIKTLDVRHGIENYILDTPKNDSSIREVDITNRVIKLFADQELEKKKARLMFGPNFYTKENFIFVNMRRKPGYPLSPLEVARYMASVIEYAEMQKKLTPHKLRHTYTSLSAEAGIELEAIQRQLGHTNDSTTTRIYMHVTKARRRADMEKLDALMDNL